MTENALVITNAATSEQLAARAALYQVFSNLLAGSDLADMDNPEYWSATVDMLEAGCPALPYDFSASELLSALTKLDSAAQQTIKADYSRFFEVGSDGVKLPIREELSDAKTRGKKEELVRFYDYFGYKLEPEFQWQPDHLALQLEFVSFLIEGQWSQTAPEKQESQLLGQRDFCQRQLLSWLPTLADKSQQQIAQHFYNQTLQSCLRFVQTDFAWLQQQLAALENV
ncbi:MAG: TorA maturation chaperone TorD [Oceanicoccus sp.]|jgi:TorA maturation chaperone TorD